MHYTSRPTLHMEFLTSSGGRRWVPKEVRRQGGDVTLSGPMGIKLRHPVAKSPKSQSQQNKAQLQLAWPEGEARKKV